MKFSAKGQKDLLQTNNRLSKSISRGIRRGAYISGKELVADLKKDMSQKKSGRTYKIYKGVGGTLNRPRLYRASAPNETPGVRTGNFRKSIDFEVRGNKRLEFGSGKNGLADYAEYLENGTSKMQARKPIGRTVDKFKNKVNSNITTEINKQIKALGFKIKGYQ